MSFEERLARHYDSLSDKLRAAGDFVAAHPVDTASRSLRNVAQEAALAPATFSRLAKALDYDSFDALRDSLRASIGAQLSSFAERADDIQARESFAERHMMACRQNLGQISQSLSADTLIRAADQLIAADHVFVFGALGAAGIAEYTAYLAHFCAPNWRLLDAHGRSVGGSLADLSARDAVVILTKPPFSPRAAQIAALAQDAGAQVMVITDTRACPALRHASSSFIVPTQSPHFYSSYVATLVVIECLIGLIVERTGPSARDRIARVEQSHRRLGEVRDGSSKNIKMGET